MLVVLVNKFSRFFYTLPPTPLYNVLITPQMNENTPSNGWNGKSRLTHPHNRCMNNFLYDWLYSRPHPGCMILYILLGGPKWGNLSSSSWLLQRVSPSTDHIESALGRDVWAPPLGPLLTFEKSVV